MKSKICFLVFSLLLTACGRQQIKEFHVDPQVQPYYEMFIAAGKMNGVDLSGTDDLIISLEPFDEDDEAAGWCRRGEVESIKGVERYYQKTPKVIMDSNLWKNMGEYGRRNLLFHELGHCLLNLEHDETYNSRGYVNSLMYTHLLYGYYGWVYPHLEPYYVQQLFNAKTPAVDPYTVQPMTWTP